MRRILLASIVTLGGLAFLNGERGLGQTIYGPRAVGSVGSPPFSPYLNLLRRGNPAYLNYFGLVRPEVDFRNSLVGLQQQVIANQQGVAGLEAAAAFPTTGHATRFLNTSHYFLNQGGQGGGQIGGLQARPGGLIRNQAFGSPAQRPSRGGRGAPMPPQ